MKRCLYIDLFFEVAGTSIAAAINGLKINQVVLSSPVVKSGINMKLCITLYSKKRQKRSRNCYF